MEDYDVIVIGGGPAGLRAAAKIAKNDVNVLCLDKKQEIGVPVRCGEGLGLGWFSRLQMQPDPSWAVQEIFGAAIISPSGKKIEIRSQTPSGYILERRVFEKQLAYRAAKEGARVQAKTHVKKVERKDGQVEVTARFIGDEVKFRAPLIVAADGVDSLISKQLGLQTVMKLVDYDSGFQYEMAGIDFDDPDLISLYFGNEVAPRGYCLTGDTEIFAKNTIKPISEIKIGEEVLTLNGWMPVSGVSERDYAGELVSVTPAMLNKQTRMTADHLVYVWNKKTGFKWKKAKDLKVGKRGEHNRGDYLVFPVIDQKSEEFLDITKYYSGIEKNGLIFPKGKNQFGAEFAYRHGIPKNLKISKELMEFFGYYVSEGSINSNGVIIQNTDEKIVKRLVEISEIVFGFKPNLWVQKRRQSSYKDCTRLNFGSKIVKAVTFGLFGKGSHSKHLPGFVYGLSDELKLAFLTGCFRGDGSVFKSMEGFDVLAYTTVSNSLAYDLWHLLATMNIVAAVAKKKNGYSLRVRGKQLDRLSAIFGELNHGNAIRNRGFFIEGKKIFLGIRDFKSEFFHGKVFDIESAGSFCPSFAVHNCWIFPKGKHVANVGIGIGGYRKELARDYLDRWIAEREGLKNGSIIHVFCGGIPVGGFLENMVKDNLIAVGDAAHQVDPIHGGGIGLAMEAADIVAGVVTQAVQKKDFSQQFLSRYNKLWYEKRGNHLLKRLKGRHFMEKLSDDDMEYLAGMLSSDEILQVANGDLKSAAKLALKLAKRPDLVKKMITNLS